MPYHQIPSSNAIKYYEYILLPRYAEYCAEY